MCLFCFSSERLPPEEMKGKYGAQFAKYALIEGSTYKISMCQAPTNETCCWLGSMVCFCPAQIYMRKKALNHLDPGSGWSNYICCQGQFGGCCCIQPGEMGEKSCPVPCMCLEAFCLPGMAVSATSAVIRERYNLGLDDDDIRLIKCNNCLQIVAICASCLNICIDCEGDDLAVSIINGIADVVFCCVAGCMTAQVNHEINYRESNGPPAPIFEKMER